MSGEHGARRRLPRPRRRVVVAGCLVAALVVAALAIGYVTTAGHPGPGGRPAAAATRSPAPAAGPTATVERRDLVKTTSVDGSLGFGDPTPVEVKAQGTVTWLPATGAALDRGSTLVRIDDAPVLVLLGGIPLYRPLATPGMTGSDVSMVAQNLVALGVLHSADPQHAVVDAPFLAAVRALQTKAGLPVDGVVAPSWAHVLPAASRVASVSAVLGDAPDGTLLSVTGTTKVVAASVDPATAPPLAAGEAVSVTLPDGSHVPAHVATVGTTVTRSDAGSGGGGASPSDHLALTVTLDDPAAVAGLDAGPVSIVVASERRDHVLVVPIAALLSLREGGFALQRRDGSLVAVSVGLFAGDLVEVSGRGLAAGMRVVTAR